MRSLDDVLQEAMAQAQRDGCHLAIDYRPGDTLPWWIGSVLVRNGAATGVINEADGASLQDALARWIQSHRPAVRQRSVGTFAEPISP